MKRIIRFLASVKLAVVIVLALACVTAWGTIVEARYNAEIAGKLVYRSWWMYLCLGALCVSLIAVMVDRWPWKRRHASFVLAHIGILVLLAGSWVTQTFGIDGMMVFAIGESNKYVILPGPELTVYSSIDAQSYTRLAHMERDFYLSPPPPEGIEIPLPDAKLIVLDYMPFALREQKIVASAVNTDAPAIRFQLQNANVNMTEWMLGSGPARDTVKDLGPAKIVLTGGHYRPMAPENAIVLSPNPDDESITFEIHTRRDPAFAPGTIKPAARKGTVKAGGVIETPWMGMVMRVLNYLPSAKEEVLFHKRERPTELTTAALKVKFNEHERWIALDSIVKFYTDTAVYIVNYANRRIDLAKVFNDPAFNMSLKKFEVGRYQGTMRAASYESLVNIPAVGDVLISMNEPLKQNGFTFYQASFQEDEATGRPTHSVLSVNRDPGRWMKYFGSLLIVIGSSLLFFNKRKVARGAAGGAAA